MVKKAKGVGNQPLSLAFVGMTGFSVALSVTLTC